MNQRAVHTPQQARTKFSEDDDMLPAPQKDVTALQFNGGVFLIPMRFSDFRGISTHYKLHKNHPLFPADRGFEN